MVEVTEEESEIFWTSHLDVPGQPFNSLRRRQLLVELKKKFKLDPLDWRFFPAANEGHVDPRMPDTDRVEDASGEIVNRKTGERVPVIYNWTCDCDRTWHHHPDIQRCGYVFFWEMFGDRWFKFSQYSKTVVETKL